MSKISINPRVFKLPKKDLIAWIEKREKKELSEDWKKELEKLKKRLEKDAPGTGKKSKSD